MREQMKKLSKLYTLNILIGVQILPDAILWKFADIERQVTILTSFASV